jgi:hypothetical protein
VSSWSLWNWELFRARSTYAYDIMLSWSWIGVLLCCEQVEVSTHGACCSE